MNKTLIRKYNVPGPRYTSYPTVPYWDKQPLTIDGWRQAVEETFTNTNQSMGLSIYIHLPYCESLCTYCGCNTRITVNHQVEEPYIETLLKEWDIYLDIFGEKPKISELHLGGGTPTFFSPQNLQHLITVILSKAELAMDPELGFEAHPNNTSKEHLQMLYDLGFRRLSLGIQSFDPKVQEVINRIQSFEAVAEVTNQAREIGYNSINYDLIYGLPLQTTVGIRDTIQKVSQLKPDRVAFYSYAHVPWIKPGQRKFTELDLPTDDKKRALYELGKELLERQGYHEIGMDHFALPSDRLYQAVQEKTLHRNFMGYTPTHTQLVIGLGASSISDTWTAFAQNHKRIEEYIEAIERGELASFRGHCLTEEDLIIRRHILNLMCHFETVWEETSEMPDAMREGLERLREMEIDDLISIDGDRITVKAWGRPFVRNICMALDARLWRAAPATQIFSTTV